MTTTYPERVTFWATGNPTPQGSKRHVGGGRMIEASKHLKPWRDQVQTAAEKTLEETGPFARGPLALHCTFHIPHGKQREATPWKAKDLDKLVRAVGDALTHSGLICDDAHIIHIQASKRWALDRPGVEVQVTRAGEAP